MVLLLYYCLLVFLYFCLCGVCCYIKKVVFILNRFVYGIVLIFLIFVYNFNVKWCKNETPVTKYFHFRNNILQLLQNFLYLKSRFLKVFAYICCSGIAYVFWLHFYLQCCCYIFVYLSTSFFAGVCCYIKQYDRLKTGLFTDLYFLFIILSDVKSNLQ